MLAVPDANTFDIVPWRGDDAPVARMFCDVQHLSGDPFEGDPRYVLKRNIDRAREKGFTFYAGPEIEFFYFESETNPVPLDHAGFFDLTQSDMASELRKRTILTLEQMGIPVEYSFHENGPSQHEIDLRYTDALTMADNVMTFRTVVRQVAQDLGVHATFMPKPISGAFGSGMHTHMSLFEGDRNVFHEPGAEFQLSKLGRAFIAGLLTHAAEITAVCNQWVNSYKRLWGGDERIAGAGGEAPAYICWGHNNRSALVRVPMYKPQKGNATRVEFRSIDPACNPYLAFAVILAAGLKGIEEDYELPPGAEDDVWALTSAERRALGIAPLPQSLADACDVMQRSELVAETLGEHVFDFFLRNKRSEWQEYRRQVTEFELDRYLPTL
jgi:glutamine synthetase